MSKEKLKGRCSVCKNSGVDVVQVFPRYPVLPAPEFPFPSYYECKSTNELISTGDVETERECEHFMEIRDEKVLMDRKLARMGVRLEDLE